jgi:thiol-disulfide isomerase/thioredoxin
MKKYLRALLLLCLLSPLKALPLSTVLEGEANAFPNKTITLSTYADLVTNRVVTLASSVIDKDGKFVIKADIKDTLSCILSIGSRRASLYLIPGQHYYCQVDITMETLQQQRLPAVFQDLPLSFRDLPQSDMNQVIKSFNVSFEDFLEKNKGSIESLNKKRVLDSLLAFQKKFPSTKGSFADPYIFYKTADLECMVNRWSEQEIFDRFIKNKAVLYTHPAFMDFLNIYFEHYFTAKSRYITLYHLDTLINKSPDLSRLLDYLGSDSLLLNERLRELVLLKNLGELYYHPDFLSQNVLTLIHEIALKSKYPEHKIIAENLVFILTRLTPGTLAPGFSFTTPKGEYKKLDDFRGKWVYLNFFTTWCEPCLPEMKILSGIIKHFGNNLEIISICCDENPLKLDYFLTSNKGFDWTFFNINDQMEINDNYQVMTYPFYVLLDKEGKIAEYPAKSPVNHLKEYLESLMKE